MSNKQSFSDKDKFCQKVGKLISQGFHLVGGNCGLNPGEYRVVVVNRKEKLSQNKTQYYVEWQP